MTILSDVKALGQQIWLDNLSRSLVQSGELAKMLKTRRVRRHFQSRHLSKSLCQQHTTLVYGLFDTTQDETGEEIFFNWIAVDKGYVHKSRLKIIDEFCITSMAA